MGQQLVIRAAAYIAQSVSELFLPIVRDPANATARRLWLAIQQRCDLVNGSLSITLEDQYNKMKLIGPETVDTDMIFSTKVEVGKNLLQVKQHFLLRAKLNSTLKLGQTLKQVLHYRNNSIMIF